nr:PREDICTED: cilia- and flagella-associated protein 74 isoform X1 [Lepisosteus oculatus]XP_015192720.1 PREDICTED: cilia- and flagella-associated protein 74 isoform X1 [Lepisosteus oculatus]
MDATETRPGSGGEMSAVSAGHTPLQSGWTDDDQSADEEADKEGFRDEDTLFPTSADEFGGFSSSSSWEEEEADLTEDQDRSKKKSYAERVRIFKLRRNLDQLDSFYKQKEHDVLKAREELKACRLRIAELGKQRDVVERDIEELKESENTAALFRLRALHKRLCSELQGEEDLESQIEMALTQNELELCQVEVELGRFSHLRQEVQREEQALEVQQEQQAARRLRQEETAARAAELRHRLEKKRQMNSLKEREAQHRKAVVEAQQNHKKAVLYLKETMNRIRQKEAEEEMQSREQMERRVQAVLSLKTNIAATRENLHALQARDKARIARQKEKERLVRESVRAEGGDVTKYMHQQKQLRELERKKRAFEEQQKSRKIQIISKILQEEALLEKRKKYQAQHFPTYRKSLDKASYSTKTREKLLEYLDLTYGEADEESYSPEWRIPSPLSEDENPVAEDGAALPETQPDSQGSPERDDSEEERTTEESLAVPEFTGLWEQKHKEYKIPKDDAKSKPVNLSKMDQEILARTLEKQRSGIVRKQVVVGREFKGCPFYSKPEVIHFKDFDVGKTYKKRVTLTNVSYSINFCKLLGVSEHLKDFISVHFEPPGAMSAGMSCDMLVTFKPMINKDLDGKVQFLSQTGPFSVSLKCTIKKCELAVDNSLIDFGTHVVGETISRVITLTNRGTLGTHFILVPSSDSGPVQLVSEPFSMEPEVSQEVTCAEVISEGQETSLQQVSGEDCDSAEENQKPTNGTVSPYTEKETSGKELKDQEVPSAEHGGAELLGSGKWGVVESSEIKPGEVQEGEIGPLSCIKLQIIFTPTIPGDVQMAFDIRFSDPSAQPIPITVRGVAIDLPVWVAQPNVDLKICMYDRLYQDSIVVHSRSSTALRLTFVVCKELRNHLEILPKTGFIQAQSTFNVQLKFLPRHSLPDDTGACFDKETGVLEVPLMIQVADQARPVPFTVHAVVTTSDLEFGRKELDFGHCSIYESVRTSVLLTNHSLLPQDFGFVGIPKFIDVQPNDGFGTLLPLETLEIDIIFSPTKAREYSFELTCKSGINRDFKLSCRAVGVHPPLELSHSLVQFGATAVNDMSTATLYVVNSHTSSNEFTHPVPRIGRGEIAPVGPTSFEFINPDNSDITITPEVGTVMPGKRCLVQVSFRPSISDEAIREEAVRLLCRAEELRVQELETEKEAASAKRAELESKKEAQSELKRGKKQPNPASAKTAVKEKCSKVSVSPKICSPFEPPNPRDIHPESETFAAAKASLLRSFADCFKSYTVPCFVASGETTDGKNPEHLQYSPHNTLYLELHCPIVRPPLVVVSDNGRTSVNFNEVATGQKVVRRVTIQNISQDSLDLSSSLLDPNGPFLLLNALRHLEPGAMHTLLISFSPAQGKKYYETLQIQTKKMTLRLNLCGIGLQPTINCSVEGGLISFGYVLEKESATQMFKLHNTSSLLVHYSLKLESLSNFTHEGLPPFLASGLQSQAPVGTQNYSGLSVFSVSPIEGAISPGKSQDITVTFQPDHESLYYSDRLKVELMNKQTVQEVQLKGAARRHTMYVSGGDPLDVPVESLAFLPPDEESTELERPPLPVLLTLKSVYSESTVPPAVRELEVGCIRSTQPMVKKNVEFALDNLPVLQQKGFSVDPVKGTVEPGQKKTITVTWAPHSGQNLTQPLCVSVPLTVKGDVTEIYNVTLLALVVRAPESGSER